jgi:NAD-dependent deacetylase
MTEFAHIVVLTGAGISAESGIGTFRDKGGIWEQYKVEDVATPQGYAKNPRLVHEFYNKRRRQHALVVPNAAHQALARLEQAHPSVVIVTQNVDALHEAAGSKNLIHMHGELLAALCARCEDRHPWHDDMSGLSVCPACKRSGTLRPDVVWFGEMPYQMDRIEAALERADLFVSIGTSGNVYPAAGFVQMARSNGARTVELNLEPSSGASLFHEAIHGPATVVVPAFVESLVG